MGKLDGKVALVTGSSRGIGAAIATLFASSGAKVALHGRDAAALESMWTAIEGAGGTAIQVTGDVTRAGDVEAIRRDVEHRLGPIDILVANAGGSLSPPGPIEDITEEAWHATVDANLTATFLCIKSFLPGMKQRGRGCILTMSSSAGRRAHPRSPIPYAAAKAAIELLTQDVAAQVGPHGVRAVCIAPETILTARNKQRIPEALQAELAGTHPIRRLGTPEDVAQAALFLASDEASWITGIVLDVAGGATMVR
jgi:3-oxoacyl-[acyl-carrier protein] reductase